MTYKLIALDVDGTLLNDDHVLEEATRQAVRRVYENGGQIVLCTGRSPTNTFYLMEELALTGVLITHNGAATVDSSSRDVLHAYSFSMQELGGLVSYCRERGIHYDANTVYDIYIDRSTAEVDAMYGKFGIVPIRLEDVTRCEERIVKFTMFASMELMDQVKREWASMGCSLTPIRSGDYFIDVMHAEASKGRALQQLAASRDIPREQVLAIGNYYNDVDMLEFAGHGVAMANSPERVKEAADAVTATNNEHGVAQVLTRCVLNEEWLKR